MRFTSDLQVDWRYPSLTSPFEFIDDCYALNVDGITAWACYDSGFPIVRIDSDVVAGWRNDKITRVKALAVGGSTAALYGGYGPDRLIVGRLCDGAFHLTNQYRVVLPGGADVPAEAHAIGRGQRLHFLTDGHSYQLDIASLRGAK